MEFIFHNYARVVACISTTNLMFLKVFLEDTNTLLKSILSLVYRCFPVISFNIACELSNRCIVMYC